MSHAALSGLFQKRHIQVIITELRAQPHLLFPLKQRVTPTGIRHIPWSGSIFAFTHELSEKSSSVNKESAEGHLYCEILQKILTLMAALDECHLFPVIYLNSV